MSAKWLGVVIKQSSGQIMEVIDADDENDIANPQWLLIHTDDEEPLKMLWILRDDWMSALGEPYGLEALVAAKR